MGTHACSRISSGPSALSLCVQSEKPCQRVLSAHAFANRFLFLIFSCFCESNSAATISSPALPRFSPPPRPPPHARLFAAVTQVGSFRGRRRGDVCRMVGQGLRSRRQLPVWLAESLYFYPLIWRLLLTLCSAPGAVSSSNTNRPGHRAPGLRCLQ